MRRRLVVVALAVVVLAALPGAAEADGYIQWPHDGSPSWSPDGKRIAFLTTRERRGLAVVAADGSGARRLLDGVETAALSPDWAWIAFTRGEIGGGDLWTARGDGSDARLLARSSGAPAWSPDSSRIAFQTRGGSLSVSDPRGGRLEQLAAGGFAPDWSPDGTRIAFASGGKDRDLYVVGSAGGEAKLVIGGSGDQIDPQWSPDGARIAFLVPSTGGGPAFYRLGVVRTDGSGLRVFSDSRVGLDSDRVSWMPDSRRLVYASELPRALFALDLASGRIRRLTREGESPSVSPDGSRLALAAAGECRDREGIHVARADGKQLRRLTNGCRVFGTGGADELRGTRFADVLLGLGGDDRLFAFGYEYGDALLGGDGDDLLVGELRDDLLRGGPGRDRLEGGIGRDVLFGGTGPDRINGGNGWDVVKARDGERDTIVCGTRSGGAVERDRVWADRSDRVARDCDVVYRPRS